MKQFSRRLLAIVVGLSLGWFTAGFRPSLLQPEQAVGHEGENHAPPAPEQHPSTQPADDPAVHNHSGPDSHAHTHSDIHSSSDHAPTPPPSTHTPHAASHTAHAQHDHQPDPASRAASLLVPQHNDAPWLKPVLIAAAALFAAAIFLGLPALKFKNPEPPDPADDQHHSDGDPHPAPHAPVGHT